MSDPYGTTISEVRGGRWYESVIDPDWFFSIGVSAPLRVSEMVDLRQSGGVRNVTSPFSRELPSRFVVWGLRQCFRHPFVDLAAQVDTSTPL